MKIEKNKPMPYIRGTVKPEYNFVESLSVGDAVTFDFSDLKWRTKYETVRKKMKRLGWDTAQRKSDKSITVWRVA